MIRFPARRYAGAAACIALIGTGAATLPAVIGQPAAASSDAPALDIGGDGMAGLGAAPLLDELPGPDAAPEAAPEAASDAPEPDAAGFIDPFAASAPPPAAAPAPAAARDQGPQPDLPDAAGDAPLLEDFEPPVPSIAGSEALPPALPAPAASGAATPGEEPLLPDAPAPASHRSAAASDAPPLDTPAPAPPAETAAAPLPTVPPAGENATGPVPVPAPTPALAGTVSAALPPAPVAAEAPAEEEPGSLPGRWLSAVRAELEVVAYHEEAGVDGDVADNPGNRVLRLAESRSALELRPTIGWKTGRVELEVSPRLRWNRVRTLIGGERRDRSEWEARISYARAAYSTGPVSVQAGRYVNLWGPSVFLSPSNPFHPRSGQTSPYIELEARDYVEASYSIPDTNWTTSVIYNFGRGDQRTGPDEDIVVGKASWYGSSVAATGLVQASREHVGIGGYGQWTPNDAVVIYGDGLLRRGPERLPRPTARGFETRGGDAWSARVLVGGSYSLTDGTTLSLEYLHNTDGYSRSEAKRAFALRDAALRPGAYLPAGTVGTLASVPFLDLGQNYLLGRVSRNNLFDSVDLSALYAYNVDDGSGRLIGNADWYLSDETSLFVNAVLFQGDRDSEFGRFSDNQIAVGLRWRPQ